MKPDFYDNVLGQPVKVQGTLFRCPKCWKIHPSLNKAVKCHGMKSKHIHRKVLS